LVAALLTLALGQGVARLVDSGLAAGSAQGLDTAAALMGAVVAALALATATRYYLVSWLGERVAADLRRRLYDHVLSLSPAWFDTARTGDILSRMTADVGLLQSLVGSAVSMGLRNAVTGTGAIVMMVATSAKLAGIVLLVLPVVVAPLVLFGRRERRLSRTAQERIADLAARAEETINGLRTVQAFGQEPAERARFGAQTEASVAAALRRIRSRAMLILAVILLGFGAITFALWTGGHDVVTGRMSGGDLAAFVFYAVLAASAGASVSELWGEIQRAGAAADRIAEVLDVAPSVQVPAKPAVLPRPVRGALAFEGVRFAYPTRPA
ncbi:ABC transporter transmembrane domain-containing protein, partial [Falsiroseomonas oryziterrae]|uniref:ABC transporter transmembrane domain-containing protein n=1 Tax=Falsiroseomonas oryziterrae TaxID=2911368 RepID=UPI0023516083